MFNFIAEPFGKFLWFLYELVGNYGVAILILAIVIKVILLPFQMKSKRGMMRQSRLQPKIAEIQKKHGANKTKVNEEMAKLYKEEGVNPASGCLWSFLPLPIMFALFYVIRQPLTLMMGIPAEFLVESSEHVGKIISILRNIGYSPEQFPFTGVYREMEIARAIADNWTQSFRSVSDIPNLREVSFHLFPQMDLSIVPQWTFLWNPNLELHGTWLAGFLLFIIPLVSGGMQFISTIINKKVTPPAPTAEGAGKSMQTMMMLMPLMSVWFGFILPAALGFYWTIGTVCQIAQDVWLTKRYTKILDAEEEEKNKQRKKKEAEIEAKRLETERRKADGVAPEKNLNTSKRKKQKGEKREQQEKAAEWEKKNAPVEVVEKIEPSRVGNRRFARGRAYDPDRFEGVAAAGGASEGETPESEASEGEDRGEAEVEYEYEGEYEGEYESEGEGEAEDESDNGSADGPPEDGEDAPSTTKFETKRFEDD